MKFNAENKQEKEINSRISKYNNNINVLYSILKDYNVPRSCKGTIYTTILRPVLLLNGSEAWSLTQKTKSKIQANEMKILQFIKGITTREWLRNVYIRRDKA